MADDKKEKKDDPHKFTSISIQPDGDVITIYGLAEDGGIWLGTHGKMQNTNGRTIHFRKFDVFFDDTQRSQ